MPDWSDAVWARVDWDRLAPVTMIMLGLIVGLATVAGRVPIGGDGWVYWTADGYALGVYGYPPPLLQVATALHPIGWQVWLVAWTTLCFGSLAIVLRGWSLLAAAALVPDVLFLGRDNLLGAPIEAVLLGNVTMPMVAAIVLGMRHPGWWAVPLLTKMTPGIGLLWFAFRREWRAFGIGLGVTAAVALVSFMLAPRMWTDFTAFALANIGATSNGPPIVGPPLWIRLIAAVALLAWAARTNRPWVVPIACGISLIGLYGLGSVVSVAVGSVGLAGRPGSPASGESRL